jgi:hypothetical protein
VLLESSLAGPDRGQMKTWGCRRVSKMAGVVIEDLPGIESKLDSLDEPSSAVYQQAKLFLAKRNKFTFSIFVPDSLKEKKVI